jgi:TolB protein
MDSYAFAHTAPVWIGKVGSFDPAARKRAAADLLAALGAAEKSLGESYRDPAATEITAQLARARAVLERAARGEP